MSKRIKPSVVEVMEVRRMMAVDVFRGATWEIYGTAGNDHLVIEADANRPHYLIARDGKTIIARAAASTVRKIRIHAGDGDDKVFVKANQYYYSDPATSEARYMRPYSVAVDAGAGNDQVFSSSYGFTAFGGTGDDSLHGTDSGDHFVGGDGDDSISGVGGRDSLDGGDGHDRIIGGNGFDTLIGGLGDDRLDVGEGRDHREGGAGRDQLAGNGERDTLVGGKGADLLTREQRQDSITAAANDTVAVASAVVDWKNNPDEFAKQTYVDSQTSSSTSFGWSRVWGSRNTFWASTGGMASTADAYVSQTNTQVAGIDEADLLETDGAYIYKAIGSKLVITDIRNPADLKVVSTTPVDGHIRGLYLDGGRLTVISTRSLGGETNTDGSFTAMYSYWRATNVETVVTTFDVSDAAAPVRLGATSIEGDYESSRYVGGKVYLVTNEWVASPSVQGDQMEGFFIPQAEAAFVARVRQESLEAGPGYTATRRKRVVSGSLSETGRTLSVVGSVREANSQLSVSIIDTVNAGQAPVSSLTLADTYANQIYMSGTSIYLTQGDATGQGTVITKLSVQNDQVVYDGRGTVDGQVNSQFALHETAGGQLAVTSNGWGAGNVARSTTLTMLNDTGDTLVAIDRLTGIAPGETLFSTRYVGDRAYFVTYETIDPLFVADLGTPDDLKLLGELKIPGFSTYLHPIDETHLIGVGQRDDDNNGTADGAQVSLFDVSNPAKPIRIDTQNLGEKWSYSNAAHDHLAFTYVPETGLLAIPLSDDSGTTLEVLKISTTAGIDSVLSLKGNAAAYDVRGVFAGETAFRVDDLAITAANLTDPTRRDTVSLIETAG